MLLLIQSENWLAETLQKSSHIIGTMGSEILVKNSIYLCVCVCACVTFGALCAGACGGQKKVPWN